MSDNSKIENDIKKPEQNNNEFSADVKSSVHVDVIPTKHDVEKKPDSPVPEPEYDMTITNSEFAITIVKSVTGTGCLGIPFSITKMGIIPAIIVFLLVTLANVINTYYLIKANEGLKRRQLETKKGLQIDNDYANLMYQLYGKAGYYIFLVFFYMTVWSVMLGTMIGMFDSIKQLPYSESFLGGETIRNLLLHILSTVICYILCCIRNTKQLFFVSWFGIFALFVSYAVVLIYGFCTIPIRFDASLLWPRSVLDFFSNLGVAPYTLGYNFCFLTYYKQVRKTQVSKTFKVTVNSIFTICLVYLALSIPTTIVYGSVKDADGNFTIKSNVVSNLPSSSGWAVFINIMMALSCVCSLPVLLSSTSELLEKNCPQTAPHFLVSDKQRLLIRFAQVGGLSLIAYLVPDFNSIINLFGGLAFVATSILIPVIIHYSVFKSSLLKKDILVHGVLGVAAFLLMVISTYFSAVSLVNNLFK